MRGVYICTGNWCKPCNAETFSLKLRISTRRKNKRTGAKTSSSSMISDLIEHADMASEVISVMIYDNEECKCASLPHWWK